MIETANDAVVALQNHKPASPVTKHISYTTDIHVFDDRGKKRYSLDTDKLDFDEDSIKYYMTIEDDTYQITKVIYDGITKNTKAKGLIASFRAERLTTILE